ncbi:MAG: helix-turn-helix transcriptional regulator [Lachnospiraceae bacterium]|nr:helix-turn-helix transcriptional regulator [Lachnospiraceae bacterium]
MRVKTVIGKKHMMLAVLFALYMAEYMICLICMDTAAYKLPNSGGVLHYLKMPAYAAGMLLFPLSQKLWPDNKIRRLLLLASNIVFIAGMVCLTGVIFEPGYAVYIISCVITLLSLGLLGGAVYYYFAMGFAGNPYIGRMSGIGGAAAFLIQILVQNMINADVLIIALMIAGFVFIASVTMSSNKRFEWMFDEPLEYAKDGDSSLPGMGMIAAGITGMILLYMICGLTDSIIVSMNFAGDMMIYTWPRLLGVAGYLAGGILSDLFPKKWLMLSALCMTVMCIPLPFMLREGYTITAMCIYYVIVVSQIEFLNVFFWDLAPRTSHPQLVACMSRVLSCMCVVILPLFTDASVVTDLFIEAVIVVLVLLCIVISGKLTPSVPESLQSVSEQERSFEAFAAFHGLTPRETDFLKVLIESDDDVSAIASDMNISTRTVYRHINSIYEKTGTETRYALMRYYYRFK